MRFERLDLEAMNSPRAAHVERYVLLCWIVRRALPASRQNFGDLAVKLYVTIAHLRTHARYVYGDDPSANIADAVITSASAPASSSGHHASMFLRASSRAASGSPK